MVQRTCIYSLVDDNHSIDGSRAHIIPSAIGGRRTSSTIVCARHNGLTNTRVEKPVIDMLAFVNTMLAIIPGRGGDVPPIRGILGQDGKRYTVRPGGFPEESKAEVREWVDGEEPHIDLSGYSERELWRIMNSLKNKYPNLMINEVRRELARVDVPFHQQLRFGPETRRLVAKIGFEYLAACSDDRTLVLTSGFDAVRRFILDGTESDDCFVFFDPRGERTISSIGPVDHAVTIGCDSVQKVSYAFVSLYGHLSLTAVLSRSWTGPSAGWAYVVDPLTGMTREDVLPTPPTVFWEEMRARRADDEGVPEARWRMGREMLEAILATSMQRRPALSYRNLVTKAWEEGVWAKEGEPVMKEDMGRVVDYLVQAIAAQVKAK